MEMLCVLVLVLVNSAAAASSCSSGQEVAGASLLQVRQSKGVTRTGALPVESPATADNLIVMTPKKAQQHLRMCNAYAWPHAMQVTFLRTGEHLATLQYKECRDFTLELQEKDQFDFSMLNTSVGTFLVQTPPDTPRTLLLVISRRSGSSMGAEFKSHAFAAEEDASALVAVIDSFSGDGGAQPKVLVSRTGNATEPHKELEFSSVVAINPESRYLVEFAHGEKKTASAHLGAEAKHSYVVLRVGDAGLKSFPEELVVFPELAKSGATMFSSPLAAVFVAWACLVHIAS